MVNMRPGSRKTRTIVEHVDAVIIGGGQAGLAMSYYLTQDGRSHVVLERSRVAATWRSHWDSFTMNTPSWMLQLPGHPYRGADPDGFLTRDQIVTHLDDYACSFRAPLRCGVQATAVRLQPGSGTYRVETNESHFDTPTVIVATGGFPQPKLPPVSEEIPADIVQLHSSEYRNPQQLAPGAVLVVGTGASGCQIAEDLHQTGRQVYLAVSGCGRFPCYYRGKDAMWWLNRMGLYDHTVDSLPSPEARFACSPYASGRHGRHNIDLRRWRREGVTLLGHIYAGSPGPSADPGARPGGEPGEGGCLCGTANA
jgi:putative flavoprotein involved in K+ transport